MNEVCAAEVLCLCFWKVLVTQDWYIYGFRLLFFMNQSTKHILHAAAKGSKNNSTRLKKISIGEFSPFLFYDPLHLTSE